MDNFVLEVPVIYLIETLTKVQDKISELMGIVKDTKAYEDRTGKEDRRHKVLQAYELLHREVGKGLLVIELLHKFGPQKDKESYEIFENILNTVKDMTVISSDEEDKEEKEDILRDGIDKLKSLNKKKEDEINKLKSKKDSSEQSGSSFLNSIRGKFKK